MNQQQLNDNISKLLKRVRCESQKSQFRNSDILVLAVSKTRPCEDIRAAYSAGLTNFGENYLQEALDKIEALKELPLTWHFIGPIQSNKTRPIAENFDWVHSIDRAKIARRLSEQRPATMPPLQVCLQVNISGEDSKSGVAPSDLQDLAQLLVTLPNLELRGLMCIPAATQDEEQQRAAFTAMRKAYEDLQKSVPGLDTLSMGMSSDMDAAILEGATLLRIGTAIFGPRNT
jgi:pyridoxal phosphate enzyme (YggS family)